MNARLVGEKPRTTHATIRTGNQPIRKIAADLKHDENGVLHPAADRRAAMRVPRSRKKKTYKTCFNERFRAYTSTRIPESRIFYC